MNEWLVKHKNDIHDQIEIKHRVTGRMDTTTVVMITYYSDVEIED